LDWLTPWGVAVIAALASVVGVYFSQWRPLNLRRAKWLSDQIGAMREDSTEKEFAQDLHDDYVIHWAMRQTGPGAGLYFAITAYLWGAAAVFGLTALVNLAIATFADPNALAAAGAWGIAMIGAILISAIPHTLEENWQKRRVEAVRKSRHLRRPLSEWRKDLPS